MYFHRDMYGKILFSYSLVSPTIISNITVKKMHILALYNII